MSLGGNEPDDCWMTCDDCGWCGDDVECIGGAFWCGPCQEYYLSIPPPTAEQMADYDNAHSAERAAHADNWEDPE